MTEVLQEKVVSALPDPLTASTHYYVRVGIGFDHYLSDSTGSVAHKLNAGVSLTQATLTHASGVINMDVSAADRFEFEADVYVVGNIQLHASKSTAGSGEIVLPGIPQENDLVLIAVTGGPTAAIDTDYTLIHRYNYSNPDTYLAYRKLGASPDTTVTTHSIDAAAIAVFRGVDPVTPFDVPSLQIGGGTTGPNPPSVTTVTDGALLVASIAELNDITGGSMAGFTLIEELHAGSEFVAMLSRKIDVASTYDPPAWSIVGLPIWWAASTVLRPAAGSGENNYTLNLLNKPTGSPKSIRVYLETKTDTGSWDMTDVDEWIGATPAFDSVGVHVIDLEVQDTRTVGEYLGVAA